MSNHTHAVIVKTYIWRDGKVLLLKRRDDDDIYPGFWDTPGGGLHEGESALDGLKREVFEETGLELSHARPLSTWSYGTSLGISFLAKDPGGEVQLSSEHTAFQWVSSQELNAFQTAENLKREIAWVISKNWHL